MTLAAFELGGDWSGTGFGEGMCLVMAAIGFAVVGFFAWLMWLDTRDRRKREAARRGICPACGYDLRATPGRCPECGAVKGAG